LLIADVVALGKASRVRHSGGIPALGISSGVIELLGGRTGLGDRDQAVLGVVAIVAIAGMVHIAAVVDDAGAVAGGVNERQTQTDGLPHRCPLWSHIEAQNHR
jgi:hypothetical protein